MPLPATMNPLQHRVPIRERILSQCTPKASGASLAACRIVQSLLDLDGMQAIRTHSNYESGFFATLCRRVDRELTDASEGLVNASWDLLGIADQFEATGIDDEDKAAINNARATIRNWENQ